MLVDGRLAAVGRVATGLEGRTCCQHVGMSGGSGCRQVKNMSYFGEAISTQDPARHEVASPLELELPRSGSPLELPPPAATSIQKNNLLFVRQC